MRRLDPESQQYVDEVIGIVRKAPHTLVPFLGSGVTAEIYGTWPTLVRGLLSATRRERHRLAARFCADPRTVEASVRTLREHGAYADLLQLVSDALGQDALHRHLQEFYALRKYTARSPSNGRDIARVRRKLKTLLALNCRLHVTTNIDPVLPFYFQRKRGSGVRVVDSRRTDELSSLWPGTEPLLFNIHGRVTHPEELVLTREQYNDALRNSNYLQTIDTLVASHHLFFVGFGLSGDDTYLASKIEAIGLRLGGRTGPHYVLERETREAREIRRLRCRSWGLRYIFYEQYDDIAEVLQYIASRASEGARIIGGIRTDVKPLSSQNVPVSVLRHCYKKVSKWLSSRPAGDSGQRWIERFAVEERSAVPWHMLLRPEGLRPYIRAANQTFADAIGPVASRRVAADQPLRIVEFGSGYLAALNAVLEKLKATASSGTCAVSYTGCDLNVNALEWSRREILANPADYERVRTFALLHSSDVAFVRRLSRAQYDVVMACFVLHHNTRRARAEIYRAIDACLAPGGLVLLADPTGFSQFNRTRILENPEIALVEFPTAEEIQACFTAAAYSTLWFQLLANGTTRRLRAAPSPALQEQAAFLGYVFVGRKRGGMP